MATNNQTESLLMRSADRFEQLVEQYCRQSGFDPAIRPTHTGFVCRCPIHFGGDHNFHWYAQHNSWHCYSQCGEGGNVATFLMRKTGLSFPKVLDLLRDFLGDDPFTPAPVVPPQIKSYQVPEIIPMSEDELHWFNGDHPAWLRTTPATRLLLQGGYCNQSWHKLYGRLTFPVRNEDGVLVGITARTATEQPLPDMNSKQQACWTQKYKHFGMSYVTENGYPNGGFPKSQVLFNEQRLKEHPDLPLIVAEGPFDVARVLDHGYPAVVAIQGSEVSRRQWDLLTKYHSRLVYALDPDTFLIKVQRYALFRSPDLPEDLYKIWKKLLGYCNEQSGYLLLSDKELITRLQLTEEQLRESKQQLYQHGYLQSKFYKFARGAEARQVPVSVLQLTHGRDLGDTTATEFYTSLQKALFP